MQRKKIILSNYRNKFVIKFTSLLKSYFTKPVRYISYLKLFKFNKTWYRIDNKKILNFSTFLSSRKFFPSKWIIEKILLRHKNSLVESEVFFTSHVRWFSAIHERLTIWNRCALADFHWNPPPHYRSPKTRCNRDQQIVSK